MRLGIIVTTIGRVAHLTELLSSVRDQLEMGDQVVISAQGDYSEVVRLASKWVALAGAIVVVKSSGGASQGRNDAVAALTHPVDYLLFPNDSSRFPAGFLGRFRGLRSVSEAGAFTVVDEVGPKFVLPQRGAELTRENVWLVIEPGMFVRTSAFASVSGFNAGLGTGAHTPWQSGEGTDLLLRLMERSQHFRFDWLPDLQLFGISDSFGLSVHERRRKLRAYGRGYGYVIRLHGYPFERAISILIGGATFGLRKGRAYRWADGLSVFMGRLEGLLGVTLGKSTTRSRSAVTR